MAGHNPGMGRIEVFVRRDAELDSLGYGSYVEERNS
jgi:hypothetical protein